MSVGGPVPGVPVTSAAGAIAQMEAIGAALPAADGLACFNRMYLDVTRQVNSELTAGFSANYRKVDQLLDAAEQSIRQSFENTAELAVDRHLSAVASLVASWTITSARNLAWTNCLLLWTLRDNPIARPLFLDALAASTALAGQMLLVSV